MYSSIINAVCQNIVDKFANFIVGTESKDFYITGGFAKSPFLANCIVKNKTLYDILYKHSRVKNAEGVFKFLIESRRKDPEWVIR